MDKPDERRQTHEKSVERDRQRGALDSLEPLVPEKSSAEEKYQRDPEIVEYGQRIVEVLASKPELVNRDTWLDMRLPQKRELAQEISESIALQTGETPMKIDLGDIGEQAAYVIPRDKETFAKLSTEKSRHATDFAREIARVHIFDLQEKKFHRDAEYAASPEGIEVERNLKVSGNRGDVRNYLVSTQCMMIAGDAARAIEAGKLIKAPSPPEKEVAAEPKAVAMISLSTEDLRLEMVNVLFGDPRVTDKKQWESMKGKPAEKRQLFSDLNVALAAKQGRDPLPAQFGDRKTALYGDGDQRIAVMNYGDIDDRGRFLEAVGMLNLRHVQELNFEDPNRYTGLVTNAKIKDRMSVVHDMGQVNYREIQWNKQARQRTGTHRIDILTNETTLLGRDIVSAYGHLTSIEEERHDKYLRDMEAQRKKAQARKS